MPSRALSGSARCTKYSGIGIKSTLLVSRRIMETALEAVFVMGA